MKIKILLIVLIFALIFSVGYHIITINNINNTVNEYQRNNSSELMSLYNENSQLITKIVKNNSLKFEENDLQKEVTINSILISQKLSQLNHGLRVINREINTNSAKNINSNLFVFITKLKEPLSDKEIKILENYLETTNKQISLNSKFREGNYLFQNKTNWIDYYLELEQISTIQMDNFK